MAASKPRNGRLTPNPMAKSSPGGLGTGPGVADEVSEVSRVAARAAAGRGEDRMFKRVL
jgi:hypothetical protein